MLQWKVQRANATKSLDFLLPALLQRSDERWRPLWVVLQHLNSVDGTLSFCVMPFYPHHVPVEPWMALHAAQILFNSV